MAIVTKYVVFIVVFVVGIPYYWLAIFTIELINGFNCTMARTLSTRELRPAECAKRLNPPPAPEGRGPRRVRHLDASAEVVKGAKILAIDLCILLQIFFGGVFSPP